MELVVEEQGGVKKVPNERGGGRSKEELKKQPLRDLSKEY